jgi:hypothetical protein
MKSTALALALAFWLSPFLSGSQTASSKAQASSASASSSPKSNISESEIAAAKAAGKVWVNLETGVYHKNGRWYGRTKNGKFMTEAEAKKAGYRESKRH